LLVAPADELNAAIHRNILSFGQWAAVAVEPLGFGVGVKLNEVSAAQWLTTFVEAIAY
jgi:hypothetical protein